jgi:hypothetical protein
VTGSVRKHHCLATIQNDAILEMEAQRAGQHAALDVTALADQVIRGIAMADALDVLVDDRTLVEVGSDIMRRGADQLDAAGVRLVVRFGTLETGRNE